ncbi:LEM3/CDC50 family protein [Tirmania nivea]|nr:LEM3/CDC50 family protein [Tirmania nivea]
MLDSADGRDHDDGSKRKEKSRRPGNTAFRQQQLKAWYSKCVETAQSGKTWDIQNFGPIPSGNTVKGRIDLDRIYTLEFKIPNNLSVPIFFYYRLTNFYQNHRRYIKSIDERQLKGQAVTLSALKRSDACSPLITDTDTGKPYYPCGLIANSLFNDTFSHPLWITTNNGSNNEMYVITDKGIAWESDRDRYKKSLYQNSDVMPPQIGGDGYTDEKPIPDLSEREDFQVWMRTVGLLTFSKLARKNTISPMLKGTYYVNITDNFNIKKYSGTKSIVISTTTVIGGKNPFLSIAYVVIGSLCVVLGTIFAIKHLFKPGLLPCHLMTRFAGNLVTTLTFHGIMIN